MSNTQKGSNQAVGQATAEGFARTKNQPMQNIPVQQINGTIPTFDAGRIAPTTGPCADVLPATPVDQPHFGVDLAQPAPWASEVHHGVNPAPPLKSGDQL
ncbi:MAG TPA: hypothetical protein VMW15_08920 [Terracidiphilus sp.]|nr:hypothetical protein [Terracidiphilus sp.]